MRVAISKHIDAVINDGKLIIVATRGGQYINLSVMATERLREFLDLACREQPTPPYHWLGAAAE